MRQPLVQRYDGAPTDTMPCDPLALCDDSQTDFSELGIDDWRGTRSFDVTDDIKAWIGGEPNNGWAILMPDGTLPDSHNINACDQGLFETDETRFRSSQWNVNTEKPTLTIVVKDVL